MLPSVKAWYKGCLLHGAFLVFGVQINLSFPDLLPHRIESFLMSGTKLSPLGVPSALLRPDTEGSSVNSSTVGIRIQALNSLPSPQLAWN